ncbi:DUF998 domain-containing protein [Microbacterium deminutum]|uniref:ABC transporter permease n=1 Tax=Microbacterium deminutum TaxID=344164 RepID=A0ABP5C0Q3_9MICO
MSTDFLASSSALTDAASPPPLLRVESAAVYLALLSGVVGGLYGLIVSLIYPQLPLNGEWSFGVFAAIGSSVIAAAISAIGYWGSRRRPGQEWRRSLAPWKFTVNTISVVIVHTALAYLATYVVYLVLALGFVDLPIVAFWAIVLMAVTLGMTAYIVFLSVSRMTTQRMSSLLMAFIVLGTLTAMVTTPDKEWWQVHFSHLGTFDDMSSWIFNGTLIAGGLLVTTFAVYIANDMHTLVDAGRLSNRSSPRTVSTLFVIMGVMLAGVGLCPVDVNMTVHNLSASGMAIIFMVLLIGGPRFLRGMPRTYFVSAWSFLGALVASIVLFIPAVGYFSLTAFEIIVFALIFGWIAVFIRFLGVAGQHE